MLTDGFQWDRVQDLDMVLVLAELFGFAILAFFLSMFLTPFLTDFLFKNKIGKNIRDEAWDNTGSPLFSKMHEHKKGTPTMAGILFWGVTAFLTIFNWSREETLLPVFFLVYL